MRNDQLFERNVSDCPGNRQGSFRGEKKKKAEVRGKLKKQTKRNQLTVHTIVHDESSGLGDSLLFIGIAGLVVI